MFAINLRALATALIVGTATIGTVGILTTTSAMAQGVRPAVGNPLNAAKAAAESGNYSLANQKIREAEAVSGRTAEETSIINQMKSYVASKSGDYSSIGGAAGASAKFSADYNARRWSDVIADEDLLRRNNLLNDTNKVIIAQAYYNMRNYAGCTRYLREAFGNGGSEQVLSLKRSCAHEAGDTRAEEQALEQLVARTGSAKYWTPLLAQALRARGLRDPQTLDIYRLKYLTGAISRPDEYMTLAQLAVAVGLPKEGQDVVNKGIQAKVLSGERPSRFINMASGLAKQADTGFAQNMAAAQAAANGDALVKMGEIQTNRGDAAAAVKTIQAGIAKGVTDRNYAQVRLGLAYLGAKQKEQAIRAFSAVRGNEAWGLVARLWTLYARTA